MRTMFTVHHNEHVSSRSFEEVVNAFESAVGSVENTGFAVLVASTKSAEEFESPSKIPREHERFHALPHRRSWLLDDACRIEGQRLRMYTIGNPLIARTMLEHDIAAGLNVPVRLMIYEDPATRTTRVTYDLPSSLMSGLKNEKVKCRREKAGCQADCSGRSR